MQFFSKLHSNPCGYLHKLSALLFLQSQRSLFLCSMPTRVPKQQRFPTLKLLKTLCVCVCVRACTHAMDFFCKIKQKVLMLGKNSSDSICSAVSAFPNLWPCPLPISIRIILSENFNRSFKCQDLKFHWGGEGGGSFTYRHH